jgi:predicted small lipoprotein YifL
MKRVLLLLGLMAMAGCGLRQPLEPAPGQAAPPAPLMARRAPTTEEMLTPPAIARPERRGEPLTRSEAREDDRFDLPPADVPSGTDPVRTGQDGNLSNEQAPE